MATKKKAKKAVKKKVAKKATKNKTVKKKVTKRKVAKKKTVKKKATKKTAKKKATKKKPTAKKATVSKTVKKQIASTNKRTTKALKHNVVQDSEIAKLQAEVAKLQGKGKVKGKKKVNSRRISEYNLFIRKQIKAGFTFTQAVREWNKYQALMAKDKRRPSAYNQFIGSQMRLGKTFLQSVALWKLAKAGKLGRKGTTKTVEKIKYKTRTVKSKPEIKYRTRTKTVVSKPKIKYRTRTIKSKPEIKYRTRTKTVESKPKIKYRTRTKTVVKEGKPKIKYRTKTNTVIKRIKSKPRVITKVVYRTKKVPVEKETTRVVKQSVDYNKIREMFSSLSNVKSITTKEVKEAVEWDEEEVAFKLVQTYFKEIARFGFKKRLTLDEIVNAYLYSLARVRRMEHNEVDVAEAVRKSGIRK